MRKFLGLLLVSLVIWSCQSESRKPLPESIRQMQLITPQGKEIQTQLVFTDVDQEQGLSGVKPKDFSDDQGMLFFYREEGMKGFWMPDTYFDLDLFYLDNNLKIIDVIRKLPHYIGRHNPELIPKARSVWSRHVLEMKATSPISQELQVGDVLKWQGRFSMEETGQKIRDYSPN